MGRKGIAYRGETRQLNDQARTEAPGRFADLPDGVTHYELAGPPDGKPVVLVHGIAVPSIIWKRNFHVLAEAGLRVLRYDLYGRGWSDRPEVEHDADLFERQLLNLLDHLGITQPIGLAGLSMGGAVSVTFTARHPDRVGKLALVDPAGLPMTKLRLAQWLAHRESLADGLVRVIGSRGLVVPAARVMRWSRFAGLVDEYLVQTQFQGYRQALLATIRSGFTASAEESYRRVGELDTATLLIWGRGDVVVPYRLHKKVRELIPQAAFHAIQGCGHTSNFEKPEVVNRLLTEFFLEGERKRI